MHPAPDTTLTHHTGAGVLTRDRIEDAAFKVWQDMRAADFRVLMAYRHGSSEDLAEARKHLAQALDCIDAALGAEITVAAEVTPDEPGEHRKDPSWDVWLSAEDFALDAADHALMRRQEDGAA